MKSVIIVFLVIITALFLGCSENEPTNIISQAPYLEITNPVMNSNVPDSTTIKISTNIDNLIRVELYIDQSIPSPGAIFREPPYEYLWSTLFYQDGSQHILQAKGYDLDGNLTDSKYVIVNVYRFMPSNLQAFIKSDTLIELSWIDNCTFETGFEIEEAINDSIFSKIGEVDSNITNYNVIGQVDINKSYYFRVRTKSKDGFSGYTNIAAAIVLLNTPDNPDINFISDTAATLSWNDNNDFETGYVIEKQSYYGSYIVKEVPANTTETVVLDSFITGQYYVFYIYAKMGYIHGERAQFPFRTLQFSAPYNLTLTGINTNSLKLRWEYNHSFETGFIIERSTDGFLYTEIGRTSSHSFTDNNLDTTYSYSYRVAAYSRYNKSDYSNKTDAIFANQLKQIHKFLVPYPISWATLSDNASIIAFGCTTSNEASILIYDTFTGQHKFTLPSPDSSSRILSQITISPDNRLLAAAGDNRYVTVWDINSGTVVDRIYNLEYPHVVKFSPGGKYLIIEKRGALRFFDVQSWQFETRISTSYYITHMDIDRDETIIATSDERTNVKLWDFNTGILIREIPQSINAYPLEFNRPDTKLYSVINTELFAWDVNTFSIVLDISNFQRRNCIAINEEKNIAVSTFGESGIGLWELESGNFVQELFLGIEEVFFSPDNYLIGRGLYPSYYIWELTRKWVTPIQ